MSAFTGTGALARLALRRSRVALASWVAVTLAFPLLNASVLRRLLATDAQIQEFVRDTAGNLLVQVFHGPLLGLTSEALVAWRSLLQLVFAAALGAMLLVIRHTRAEEDAGRAWKLANVLRVHRDAIDESTVASFLKRCLALHEKRGPVFQVYFEILRSVAPGELREAILKRARELMKKRVEDADRMLRLLEREDLATGASDYLLAISQLRTLNKDIAMAPRH